MHQKLARNIVQGPGKKGGDLELSFLGRLHNSENWLQKIP